MKSLTNPIIHIWRWWFTPRSTDPTVVYRERALLVLIPIIVLLRALGIVRSYSATSDIPTPYAPLWVSLTFFIIPILFSIYFLAQQKVEWAGAFFILHWYLTDLLSLPVEGYWYPGYQISIIIQAVLGALFLPSRAILYFLIIQLTTTGIWGRWLDVNYFDPPLLSTGEPVASFWRAFPTLATQETIIVFIVRYLRTQMEKSLRLQQVSIQQLEIEATERKLAEEMRKKLIKELEQRNAELERLSYTLSHELKSPLITIRGFLGYLREDAVSGNIKRLEIDIQRITDGTEKMLRLINELIDLMSVGRISPEFEDVPLRTVVDEAVQLVHEKIVKKNVVVQIADNLPQVHGSHKQLLEVFQNLLENAIKFTGYQSQPKIEIGQKSEQPIPVFYVRDNGIGIEPRFADRIFGIFHKLDAQSEGTGIGLALVKRIIETHGGKVWVESKGLGKGSTFCFTIPNRAKAEN